MLAESFLRSGKVRDLYVLDDGRLLLVASDRISAFDVVLPTTIPDKGRVLTGLSRFWFAETAGIVPNHLLDTDPTVSRTTSRTTPIQGIPAGRRRPTRRTPRPDDDLPASDVVPVEAVVRGYLAGSGWKEYQATRHGLRHPAAGGPARERPAARADLHAGDQGRAGEHDENIGFDRMIEHIATGCWARPSFAGRLAEAIRDRALRLYGYAAAVAERRGILLADTKFEFGLAQAWGPRVDSGRTRSATTTRRIRSTS